MSNERLEKEAVSRLNEPVLASVVVNFRGYARRVIGAMAKQTFEGPVDALTGDGALGGVVKDLVEQSVDKAPDRVFPTAPEPQKPLPPFLLIVVSQSQFSLWGLKTSFWTSRHSVDELLVQVPKGNVTRFDFQKGWPIPIAVDLADGRSYQLEAARIQHGNCEAVCRALQGPTWSPPPAP